MQRGTLDGIFLAPKVDLPLAPVASARVEVGAGLVGDRHHEPGAPATRKRALTLIAAEALEDLARRGLPLAPGASRRQLVVRGLDLARLEGRRFRVGAVLLEGTGPCRPCDHLEELTRPGVRAALEGQGGLTCRVLEGGTLHVGDAVVELAEGTPGGAPGPRA